MTVLLDTSVLVAALVTSHSMHEHALPWLVKAKNGKFKGCMAAHSLAELYAVLTTLPVKPRIGAGMTWRMIEDNLASSFQIVSLTNKEYRDVVKSMAERGLTGGIVYDALIVKAAMKANVDQLITLNPNHFRKVWSDGEKKISTP